MKTLKDHAAQYKWEFRPDDRGGPGGAVMFANGFLKQREGEFITGRFYCLEAPVTEFLSLEEIGALKSLGFGVYLVPQVGKFNVTFIIGTDDEAVFSGVRKMLEWQLNGGASAARPAPQAAENPRYAPMKKGEFLPDYARRCGISQEEALWVLGEIPVEGASAQSGPR